ncbi:hypothetical protein CF328_g6228 [Tilletia controversa]|nr:hypothetical protein CF328_g6228 [Tilletia controversa]
MSSNGKHTREEDALDAPRKTRATPKARADVAPALDSSSTSSGVAVGRDLHMTASSMSVNVHETYQTARKAQPAVLSLLAGIKSLGEYTAQQDKIQSGLDKTLTATRAEVARRVAIVRPSVLSPFHIPRTTTFTSSRPLFSMAPPQLLYNVERQLFDWFGQLYTAISGSDISEGGYGAPSVITVRSRETGIDEVKRVARGTVGGK